MLYWKHATRGHKCFLGDILFDVIQYSVQASVLLFQDLSNNYLLSAGAECVAKILVDNISLKSMKLSGNVHIELYR